MASPEVPVAEGLGSLRRLRWLAWIAIVALIAVAGIVYVLTRSSGNTATNIAAPPIASWAAGKRPAPTFSLHDENGAPVALSAFHGRPLIVTFLDPKCTDFCPLEAKQVNAMLRSLPAESRPPIVAVSVNVYGNDRATLVKDEKDWQFGPEWHWAIGSPAQLARVWRDYQIGVLVKPSREVVHTEAAYLIDAAGNERAVFMWPFTAKDVAHALKQLG